MEEILRVDCISKSYKKPAVKAVDAVGFSVYGNEIFALIGESGSGKSTLGKIIGKLLSPDTGTVYFKGNDIFQFAARQDKNLRRAMQIVFQDTYAALNAYMTVAEIVTEPLKIHKLSGNADKLLAIVGLESSIKNRYPRELSGGQCRRVNLARALALQPELMIVDELTSGLDLTVQAGLINLILDLQKELGMTWIFISHDLDVVEHIADRVGVMEKGRLVETGTTTELFTNPQHQYVQKLLSSRFAADCDYGLGW